MGNGRAVGNGSPARSDGDNSCAVSCSNCCHRRWSGDDDDRADNGDGSGRAADGGGDDDRCSGGGGGGDDDDRCSSGGGGDDYGCDRAGSGDHDRRARRRGNSGARVINSELGGVLIETSIVRNELNTVMGCIVLKIRRRIPSVRPGVGNFL